MSNKNNQNEEHAPMDFGVEEMSITETISRSEEFLSKNKNLLFGVIGGIVVVFAGWYYYSKVYSPAQEKEAAAAMYSAERFFEVDSFKLAINGDKNNLGFKQIIEDFGSTKAGNLAHYYMGVSLLRTGQYNEAVEELKGFSSDDQVLTCMAYGAIGDAYLELDKKDDALSYYKKAYVENVNNFTTPYYLQKSGELAELMGKNEDALSLFEKLKSNYGTTQEGQNADKYILRLQTKLGR